MALRVLRKVRSRATAGSAFTLDGCLRNPSLKRSRLNIWRVLVLDWPQDAIPSFELATCQTSKWLLNLMSFSLVNVSSNQDGDPGI